MSCHHILPVVLPSYADREQVMEQLRADGIQTTIHYPPVHALSLYQDRFPDVHLPLTEEFASRELTLPLHPRDGRGRRRARRTVAGQSLAR